MGIRVLLVISAASASPAWAQQAITAGPRGRSACVTRLREYFGLGEDLRVCLRGGDGGQCRVWGCQSCDPQGSGRWGFRIPDDVA
jgi:hypothetical protein